jgi:ABC-type multidrug transport system fused ATPase/permease subunit
VTGVKLKISNSFQNSLLSDFKRAVNLLPSLDRMKLYVVILYQIFLGLLDLLGVLMLGLLGGLALGLDSEEQSTLKLEFLLRYLRLEEFTPNTQIYIVGCLAVTALVGRTFFSVFLTRRILLYFSHQGAKVSTDLLARLLSQPLLFLQKQTSQETLFKLTRGVEYLALQVLAVGVVLISDLVLLLTMSIGLLFISPIAAFSSFLLFACIGWILSKLLHRKASDLGAESSKLNMISNQSIVEVVSTYREAVVSNRRNYYARAIGQIRFSLADVSAHLNFLPYVSKYVIESAAILGALVVGGVVFIIQDSVEAFSTLAIFLAAATRLTPSVLRIQQGSIQVRTALGQSVSTLDLIDQLDSSMFSIKVDDKIHTDHDGFEPWIKLRDLSLTFPGSDKSAVCEINLDIPTGATVAIVGPSGAGKTTLIDLMLGIISPDSGLVLVSGVSPLNAFDKWPGAIAYVPQEVTIVSGSIRENISLGFPASSATDEMILHVLKISQLDDFVSQLANGVDTQVGERGAYMSGGQRQRLGIARALLSNPRLLVLDEATSSLDGETELGITEALEYLRGETTIVMIAHRLSTIQNADMVVYMADGKIKANGNFQSVRELIPEFEKQAKNLGL